MKQTLILHYEIAGHGQTVVLLHGFMASSRYWNKVIAELSQKYRVIAIDLLGFGDSPKPSCSRYDYDAQMNSINATLDELKVKEKFILVGHSMGALIALRYARVHGKCVERLVLANMPILFTKKQAKQNILGQSLLYRIALRPGIHAIVWPIFKLVMKLRFASTKLNDSPLARIAYLFQSTGISRLRSLKNVIYVAKIEADLRALAMATTVLSGLHDKRAKYADVLPRLQLGQHVRITNVAGGHHFPITQPQLFADIIAT